MSGMGLHAKLALGFFDLEPGLLDLGFDGGELFDRGLFTLPLRLQRVAQTGGIFC